MGAGCHFHAGLDFCNFASQGRKVRSGAESQRILIFLVFGFFQPLLNPSIKSSTVSKLQTSGLTENDTGFGH